jgi:ATP/maltotriose-dependent transcriptional regulator MalT
VNSEFEKCDSSYEESLALYRQMRNDRGVASLLQRLANSATQRGDFERARTLLDESQEIAAGRFPYIEIANISVLGRVALASGEIDTGVQLLRQSADMARDADWHWWQAGALASLALVAVERAELDDAERDSVEALRLIRGDEGRPGSFLPLTVLARVELARGRARRAGLLWGAVEAETTRTSQPFWRRVRAERAGPLLTEVDPVFLSALDEGAELEFWDAVAIALGELEPPQTVP